MFWLCFYFIKMTMDMQCNGQNEHSISLIFHFAIICLSAAGVLHLVEVLYVLFADVFYSILNDQSYLVEVVG